MDTLILVICGIGLVCCFSLLFLRWYYTHMLKRVLRRVYLIYVEMGCPEEIKQREGWEIMNDEQKAWITRE